MWAWAAAAAAQYASESGKGGGDSGASGKAAGRGGESQINIGGLTVPNMPGALNMSNPSTAVIVGAGVLIIGVVLLKSVAK